MVIRGRIEKGVVVLEEPVSLPEGTEVTVLVRAASEEANEGALAAERRRVLAIMDRIAAMPIQGASEPVSGADHDKALYSLECGGLPPL
jgi:predicted DNA-binding antitoxin AbrB/MazE fold protein